MIRFCHYNFSYDPSKILLYVLYHLLETFQISSALGE